VEIQAEHADHQHHPGAQMNGMTRSVERLLGARTPFGRVVFVENCTFQPTVLVQDKGGTHMMLASRLLAVEPRAERLAVEPSRLNPHWGGCEGFAVTDSEHAHFWLEPVLVGVA
jgi:hypothetical protein